MKVKNKAQNTDKPTILLCTPVSDFAGVARHLADIAMEGIPGYNLIFFCPEGELSELLTKKGVNIRTGSFGPKFGFRASFIALYQIIKEVQPDIVHSHLAYADIVTVTAVYARKFCKISMRNRKLPRVVSTEHGIAADDLVFHKNIYHQKLMQIVHRVRLWFTDGKIAVSRFNAEQMSKKWGAKNTTIIPNGINIEEIAGKVADHRVHSDSGILRIVSMARLAPEKKIDVLVDAFARALETDQNLRLEIAGKGECLELLQNQVDQLGLEKYVWFSGFNDPFEVMGRNDLLVQLSIAENNSYTLLEAKAGGLKVLATAMGGNPEQLSLHEQVPALTSHNRSYIVECAARKILESRENKNGIFFKWDSVEKMVINIANKYDEVLSKN